MNTRKILIFLSITISSGLASTVVWGQNIGINNPFPNSSALLDLSSTGKGLLVPRMTTVQRIAIVAPATGLLVYETTTNQFFYFDGTTWRSLLGDNKGWLLTGNGGTVNGVNFLGTTDNVPLNFRVNNEKAGKIDANGTTFYGYQAGNLPPSGSFNTGIGYHSLYSTSIGYGNTATGYNAMYANTYGYRNTASGVNSLYNNTTGWLNAAFGYESLTMCTTGANNTAVGGYTLFSNTTGFENTAVGRSSLYYNSVGTDNSAYGYASMGANTIGNQNTAIGVYSLNTNVGGNGATAVGYEAMMYSNNAATQFENHNVAVGYRALRGSVTPSANTGNNNTAIGYQSLWSNSTGSYNTGNGTNTLGSNTTGHRNTALGYAALTNNIGGAYNTVVGVDAMFYNQSGYSNSALGYRTLFNNTTGHSNIAIGEAALYYNTTGFSNSAIGPGALSNNTTGSFNTGIGNAALNDNQTGTYNTSVGYYALEENDFGSNNSALGRHAGGINTSNSNYGTFAGASSYPIFSGFTNSSGFGYNARPPASNTVRIGNSSVTSIGGYAGWTNLSDARFKTDVKENVKGLEFIMKLRPVTYRLDTEKLALRLKEDMTRDEEGNITTRTPEQSIISSRKEKSRMLQTGFIAQEVEAAAQSLGYDFSGVDKPKNEHDFYGLRYAEFTVPLVKAVQEQQMMIEKQQKIINQMQKEIDLLKILVKYEK